MHIVDYCVYNFNLTRGDHSRSIIGIVSRAVTAIKIFDRPKWPWPLDHTQNFPFDQPCHPRTKVHTTNRNLDIKLACSKPVVKWRTAKVTCSFKAKFVGIKFYPSYHCLKSYVPVCLHRESDNIQTSCNLTQISQPQSNGLWTNRQSRWLAWRLQGDYCYTLSKLSFPPGVYTIWPNKKYFASLTAFLEGYTVQ